MDDLVRLDGELVKRLRREKGWTQARLSDEIGSVGVGWVRKVEAGKTVRLEWNGNSGAANAGEDLATALDVELDTLILDLLNGRKIKRLRERCSHSPEQLAEHAHLNVEVVRAAEAGQFVHRVDTRSLAEAMDVPPFELLLVEETKGLDFDTEDSRLNMQAGMIALGLSIQRRAETSGAPIPADEELRKEAHGRLMFAMWKLSKDVGTEGSPLGGNSPYVLAIETAIGCEVASQYPIDPDAHPVEHAKRVASGLDKNMSTALSHYEKITRQTLNDWIGRQGLELDWGAPDADLRSILMAGWSSLGHAIFSNASGGSIKLLKACAREALKILDFLCVFVTRNCRYFSTLSPKDHAEFIRLVMVFVLACYTAGKAERRLTFLDAVELEQSTENILSVIAARILELPPEPE